MKNPTAIQRFRERQRAAAEGREPAQWAALQRRGPKRGRGGRVPALGVPGRGVVAEESPGRGVVPEESPGRGVVAEESPGRGVVPVPLAGVELPTRAGAKEWRRVLEASAPILESEIWFHLLAHLLERWSAVLDRTDALGPVVQDEQGRSVENPYWRAEMQLFDRIVRMVRDAGLSPAMFVQLRARAAEGLRAASATQAPDKFDGGWAA